MSADTPKRADRRLAAILAADVVGYSRLMGADEEGTLAALKAIRRELGDLKIAEHRGRIVKTTGDGMLVEFASVVDAVRCAVAVQEGMAARSADIPADRRIEFRIGINLGDIISDDNDIYGDGVNVAARLEGLAEPGGICVSGTVHDQVRDKLDIAFDDQGEQQVKNIARPVHVFRIRLKSPVPNPPPHAGEGSASARVGAAALALPDKPSLAVLPFQNMSGDPEQEYFADGMVEEITTAIARLPWLFVIARNSSFTYKGKAVDVKQVARELGVRYVLEGSVRKAGNRVRITGQLIDTATGAHIWADRFDDALDDIFELQDQVASSVAGAIEPKLRQSEIARAIRKPTESLGAYDLFLRAQAEIYKDTPEAASKALKLAKQAIGADASFAPAAAMVGLCRHHQRLRGWGAFSTDDIAEAVGLARQAIAVGKDDPETLWMGGWVLATMGFDLAAGLNAIERSLRLNPNSFNAWTFYGWLNGFFNRPAAAIDACERALRLSPLDPWRWSAEGGLGFAYLLAGQYEEAIEWAGRAVHTNPGATFISGCKASACGYLGRGEEGRACIEQLSEFVPGFTNTTGFKKAWEGFCLEDTLKVYLEGLRLAGLPEE